MRRVEFFAVLVIFCGVCQTVSPFIIVPGFCERIILLKASPEDNGLPSQNQPETTEAFMENASRRGADKVASMSIEERTKRAMLAETVEDRIFSLHDELELLLPDNGMALLEKREKIEFLSGEIKASEEQYEALVSGKPSSMLVALDALDNALNDKGSY